MKAFISLFSLRKIVTDTTYDTYIKLIISTLDYSCDGMAREIFSKAINSASDVRHLCYFISILQFLILFSKLLSFDLFISYGFSQSEWTILIWKSYFVDNHAIIYS